jgi:hypothetical protein
MAKTTPSNAGTRHSLPASTVTMAVVATVAVPLAAVFALPSVILVCVGFLPSVAALFLDRRQGKLVVHCVAGLNACGVLATLLELWSHGHTIGYLNRMLLDPAVWLAMYGGGAIGWGLYLIFPVLAAAWLGNRNTRRVTELRAEQARLVEEWGRVVASAPGGAESDSKEDD